MPEVLRDIVAAERVHTLRGPGAVLDHVTSEVLDAAIADATARAFREGEAAGRAAAVDAADRAGAAITQAFDGLLAEVAHHVQNSTQLNLDFVAEVATAVLERVPPDDATAVLDRVRRAVETLDELGLQVRLHPDDHAAISDVAPTELELVADASIARGDARIIGASSGAELTRTAMLSAAIQVLGQDRT